MSPPSDTGELREWPRLKLTRRAPSRRPQDMSAFRSCDCGCQTEAETYVPASQLAEAQKRIEELEAGLRRLDYELSQVVQDGDEA